MVLWKKDLDITVIESNERFIEILIKEDGKDPLCCLLIYGELDSVKQREFFENLISKIKSI